MLRDHPRFITVRYEDLVSRPDCINEMIRERMPFLKPKESFRNFYLHARPSSFSADALNGLRPLSEKSVGNWHNHMARVLGQINKHGSIATDLVEYGYERDDSWEKALASVTPDLSDSHPSAFDSPEFISKKLRWNKLRALRTCIGHLPWLVKLKTILTGSIQSIQNSHTTAQKNRPGISGPAQ